MSDEENKEPEVAPETTQTGDAPMVPEAPVAHEVFEEEEKLPGAEIRVNDVKPGMTIRVHERVKDINAKGEERERLQVFQGMTIGIRGAGISKTMTVRRENKGYGVEKIYPLNSPTIAKVELVKTAKVRRAKLAYLQNLRNRFKRKLKEKWAATK